MNWFFERLSHINPTLDYQDLLNHDDDFKKLLDLKIIKLKETLEAIPCDLCDENHTVSPFFNSKKEIVISCSGNSRIVNQDEMKIWQFDIQRFLELAVKELKIKSDIKSVVAKNLWLMGTLQKDGKHFLVFYSRTNDLNSYNTFFDGFKSPVRAFVIFTNTETPLINLERAEVVVVPIADMVELKKSTLVWDTKSFQEQTLTAFRQVVFYPSNGDLAIMGKVLGNIKPHSPEYFFIRILWDNFGQPVSHRNIYNYIKEGLGKGKKNDYASDVSTFCNKMKNKIKTQLGAVVDRIVIPTETPDGLSAYKMTNTK